MLSFDVTAAERATLEKIAARAVKMQRDHDRHAKFLRSQLDFEMDVTAAHASGNPLDLDRLLAADDFNFAHDVFGIERHLDRDTGELRDFFSPRFSRREPATV